MTEDAPVRRRKPWGLSRAPGMAHGVAARARRRSAKRGERGTGGLVVSSAERGGSLDCARGEGARAHAGAGDGVLRCRWPEVQGLRQPCSAVEQGLDVAGNGEEGDMLPFLSTALLLWRLIIGFFQK